MPSYKVISKGFHGGKLYDPDGKRTTLHTDDNFPMKGKVEQVPCWLEPIKAETIKQAGARKAAATKAAKKAATDAEEIKEASFMGEGEAVKSDTVETL